jgi:protein O-GlcNAc transferase
MFTKYWYKTGPAHIITDNLKLLPAKSGLESSGVDDVSSNYTILIKREPAIDNLWHTLMEIFSLDLTLNTLRSAKHQDTHLPFLHSNTELRILLLDEYDLGPFIELWQILAPGGILRKGDLSTHSAKLDMNIILPLPGGSNPFWSNDWTAQPCKDSALLNSFASQLLQYYNLDQSQLQNNPKRLTFINRTTSRQLANQEEILASIRKKYQFLEVQVVDFAGLRLEDQFRIAAETDILVGVHGAGLAHSMFMRPGTALIEILPPSFNFLGFRNMAHMRQLSYYSIQAEQVIQNGDEPDWHTNDLLVKAASLLDVIGIATEALLS